MAITVTNLLKTYGAQRAVNNISFTVDDGAIVGFLGPNGAGKSTTMKMITGYLKPDAGRIFVNGVDVVGRPLEAKKKMGYLPESNALYHDMYVREYLQFIASVHELSSAQKQVETVIETVGLAPESTKRIGQLSKGYKQRVGLAAALIHNPEVLILDEPTSGLDPNQIVEIRQVIKEQGKTKLVLFSSHILSEVEALCDRVIIINRGSIVADDTLARLQMAGAASVVKVAFAEDVDAAVLAQLPFITRVGQPVPRQFILQTSDAESVRRNLLQLAVDRNLNIVSLQNESKSLEAVFRNLTQPAATP